MDINPVAHDTKTAELHELAAKAKRSLEAHQDRMHRMAGDRKEWIGRQQYWKMTGAQVGQQLRSLYIDRGNQRDLSNGGLRPSEAIDRENALRTELAEVMGRIEEMETVYREHRWTRYFPCLNSDGHIHSSYRACPSVRWDTAMAWYPQLSGKTVEDAVAELGPTLCSICFPAAPVEWKRNKSDIDREAREAAKAAKAEAKFAKRLRDSERFRSHRRGEWIETVAACKQALREEREFFYYYGRGPHPWHAGAVETAKQATEVLLAREAANAGTGATQAEIDKIIVTADKKHRQEA